MPKYQKKPVIIEAVQFTGKNFKELKEFITVPITTYESEDISYIIIPTLEGDHRADPGDFIIKGIKGEFYPCKPDIFAETYDPA